MPTVDRWLKFGIAGNRYALPVQAVAQVVALRDLRPVGLAGWAGLLALAGGALPLADGRLLIGGSFESRSNEPSARGRGVVLRGTVPFGFTVDTIHGVVAGAAFPVVGAAGLSPFAMSALPSSNGSTIVLDAERMREAIVSALAHRSDGSVSLRPLVQAAKAGAVAASAPSLAGPPAIAPRVAERQLVGVGAATEALASGPSSAERSRPTLGLADIGQPPAWPHPGARRPAPAAQPLSASTARAGAPLAVVVLNVGKSFEIAIAVDSVVDLIDTPVLRPAMNGPAWADGEVEWRGQRLPAVDLSLRLGGPPSTASRALVLKLGATGGDLALLGGEVLGSARLPGMTPGSTNLGVPNHWVVGVAARGARPLVVVDPSALVVA
jgi:chemotaxis signal transduction protein